MTENKATVSSLLCFQCLLQASDGDFSISWWKWHFSICRCFLFDIMDRLFARGQTNPNHGFTTSRRFCLIFYSWRIVYFNVFREFVALSVQTHLLIKKTWRTFICSSPRIVLRGVLQTKLRLSPMKESTIVANIPLCAELESWAP